MNMHETKIGIETLLQLSPFFSNTKDLGKLKTKFVLVKKKKVN